MEVDVPLVAAMSPKGGPWWPIPPLFRVDSGLPESEGRACTVELMNGQSVTAELLSLEPAGDSITLATSDRDRPHRLELDSVRSIRLSAPLSLSRDTALMTSLGTDAAQLAEDLPFNVRFKDGKHQTGVTRGFVKDKSGIFLYVVEGKAGLAVRCFIPSQQLDDVQIGPLLGDTLVRNQYVSDKVLAMGLDKQARLRQQKLGQQLLDRGIVTAEDLKRALQAQKRRPAVRLGELLVESRLITPEQLAEGLKLKAANQKRRLGDILVEMGAVSVRLVQMALSDKLGIPFINARDFKVDPLALGLVSGIVANRYQALPLLRIGDSLVVAVDNPLAIDFVQELRFLTGHTIVAVIANPDELRQRIIREYAGLDFAGSPIDVGALPPGSPDASSRGQDVAKMRLEDLTSALARETSTPFEQKESDADTKITDNALVRLVNKIIIDAHAQGASDIHIESNPGNANTRIRFRKDGDLEDYLDLQPAYRNALVSRIKIMANLDISEHRHAQDGKIAFGKFGSAAIELRVAVVPTSNNMEDVVMRLLGGVEPLPLEGLGLSAHDLSELKKMVSRSYGLILVCGPTGSGKTTTLHSVLHHINSPDIKIWTAEDPVEITQAGLRQVQINSHIDWTFAAAMRAFLRADPDVIMVGEMRDAETTKIGIEASLTGHLVFSTLHTNSAAESVVRLLELGMDPFNFADALIGILSQRLARKLCAKCRSAHTATEMELSEMLEEYCVGTTLDKAAVLETWRKEFSVDGQILLYDAVGCDACRGGYKGRVGVYELLSGTPDVKHFIRSRGTVPQVVEAGLAGGMRLLRQDAIDKTLRGLLDRASARAASS